MTRRQGSKAARRQGILAPKRIPLATLLLLAAFPLGRLAAQQDLDESRRRLEEVKKERARLESERTRLQGQVHDLGAEVENLERQWQTTNRIVNELDAQIG